MKFDREILKIRSKTYTNYKKGLIHKDKKCSICGKRSFKLELHHDDYNTSLDVRTLCHSCHVKLHYLLKPVPKKNQIDMFYKDMGGYNHLVEMYKNKIPVAKIRQYFGVSKQTVYNWFDKFGLKNYFHEKKNTSDNIYSEFNST